ncbi:gamma-glutamylcyclotransferase [Falsirhodobacter halotolerans]|uniref:gamma-glutamylcyclotransferase n=1 Tax=Falsirhodobacter halotolerans TaxID=1146892 RepID=UPI001FD3E970|nr:gamma-glutamylcyclotransferase [Falsirhodobacter halotolerans]MCJ8138877.1 gamma-glutamylcyclotransferase [Falsirhodobacter halotolerans]
MPRTPSPRLSLTDDAVLRTLRHVPDPGPPPGWTPLTDADYDDLTADLMRGHQGPVPIFAYGSLIWNPDFTVGDIRKAVAHGWHRSFCLEIRQWRGSEDCPGLMMALARGGSATGLIMEIAKGHEQDSLRALLKRELVAKELVENVRWVQVKTERGVERALTFWAGPKGDMVVSLPPEEQAWRLAHACGHGGSGAQYLHNTVRKLEEYGLRDRNLHHLEHLVATEIAGWPIDKPHPVGPET